VDPYQPIHNYLRRLSMMRRVEACIESHGGHFEHLHSFSYNPRILIWIFLYILWKIKLSKYISETLKDYFLIIANYLIKYLCNRVHCNTFYHRNSVIRFI
jgi:hypothetical protein